jgi:hypothetical protein
MSLSSQAEDAIEAAIEVAVVEVLGEDALDEHPDLVDALDEVLATEDDRGALAELAEGVARLSNAEYTIGTLSSTSERTDVEREVSAVAIDARDALDAYVEERVEERVEDAIEWLGGDVSLDDLDGLSEDGDRE